MRVLGLASNVHLSSAALVDEGVVLAGAAEERFTRDKHTRVFPRQAVEYCLSESQLSLNELDAIAVSANPAHDLSKRSQRQSNSIRYYPEALYAIPNQIAPFVQGGFEGHMSQLLGVRSGSLVLHYVSHHLAHAANAFLLSGYRRAAILTVDGRGEDTTVLFGRGEGKHIETFREISYPHSLGLLYGAVTEHLGFRIDRDEWKVMGLSAYGNPESPYYVALREMVELKNSGTFELDLNEFRFYLSPYDGAVSDGFRAKFGEPRRPDEPIGPTHRDLAAAVQRVFENIMTHMLDGLYRESGERRLAAGGGSLMNSSFNGRITSVTPFEESFVSSCPDDSGTSIGAALYVDCVLGGSSPPEMQTHNYYGPSFHDSQIEDEIALCRLPAVRREDVEAYTAKLLARGRLVGWFQGRMEFGQRALGNRSILADPRSAATRERINQTVKFRESFRPFGPSVLVEEFTRYFGADSACIGRFMERALPVLPTAARMIEAVVHVDGTARPHVVTESDNLRLHRLLLEFGRLTGVSVLLNTSFNAAEEPIVCSPKDAIRTFFSTGLDALVLGSYVIEKESR